MTNKETSSRVSSIAATILSCEPATSPTTQDEYNSLLAIAKTLAGSALSQDETPGQAGKIGSHGIHPAPEEFSSTEIAADPILHFFHYAHLPPTLQSTSRWFANLAWNIVTNLPRNAERAVALRKLLEAKDAAVRANLPGPPDFHTNKRLDAEPELGEPVETGGHDEDRDGPVPFGG